MFRLNILASRKPLHERIGYREQLGYRYLDHDVVLASSGPNQVRCSVYEKKPHRIYFYGHVELILRLVLYIRGTY